MSGSQAGGYAGDVTVKDAWANLARSAEATLIDVRTAAEWTYVGVPALSSIGKSVVLVEWDEFPSGALVPDFIGRLKAELDKLGIKQDAPLYFLCRSGNRSRHAAVAATAAGYSKAFNVAHGFEGRLDAERHRGSNESWKGEGLPWVQS
jgi:rhodanese-related sulfurtransferase